MYYPTWKTGIDISRIRQNACILLLINPSFIDRYASDLTQLLRTNIS